MICGKFSKFLLQNLVSFWWQKIMKKKKIEILPFFLIFYSCFSNLVVIWRLINPFLMERTSKEIFSRKKFFTSEISVENKKGLVNIIFLHIFQFFAKNPIFHDLKIKKNKKNFTIFFDFLFLFFNFRSHMKLNKPFFDGKDVQRHILN